MSRILFVTSSYPLDSASPSGIFIARLVEKLSIHHKITVLTPGDTIKRPITRNGNITIIPFKYAPRKLQILAHSPGGIPAAIKRNPYLYLLLPFFISGMFFYCLRYGKHNDIFHANWAICGLIAGLAGVIINKPVITTLRGEDFTRAKKNKLDRFILNRCIQLCSKIVGVSNAIVSELCKSNPNYFHKISLIENGVDEVFLNITRTPKQSKSETLRFITIGSLIPRKGVDTILHALKNCSATKQVYLTIVGDGPEKDNLLVLSRSFENINQISFTGGVKPSEIPQLLANHDVFLLASYSEGRPNVILEAMAANMPVIATNIEGVNELVIPNKTGLLFEAGSRKQLSENIDYLINNPSMQRKMGEAARSAIIEQGLTWERTAIHYKQIYNNLIFEKI